MIRLFESASHVASYVKYRPTYPKELFKSITDYCKEGGASFKACLDLGCGPGQSTVPLADYYDTVIGIDISEEQIKAADTSNPKVTYMVGSAEDLSFLEDSSVDLITCAQAFHWCDHER